jgi:hypothetical protein
MKAHRFPPAGLLLIAALWMMVSGCGASGGSDLADLDGNWENPVNKEKVVIQLSGEKKSIAIGDAELPVSVKKIEGDTVLLHVSDQNLGEQDWKVVKIWDDRGVSFSLKFKHGDATDKLVRQRS